MRIQLLLADQEVELTKDVQIPLNKAYQNLWNPTDIIVDYSKTISIPITVTNNRVLGNAYRLDRTIIENNEHNNIGLYLDPTKRIPFNLLYNGEELMSGYAKFTSANYSKNNKSYNLNLFGVLGDFFYKMREVVTSSDKLTNEQKSEEDGGSKYVLNDHIGNAVLDAEYVKKSWDHPNNNINDFTDPNIIDQDIIGFAPAYRGYYGMDFKSSNVQVNGDEIMNMSTLLEHGWANTYCLNVFGKEYGRGFEAGYAPNIATQEERDEADDFVSQLGASDVIGDGMKEYQMGEYRSYHQRPFIYINKLFYMFQEKAKELTGYDLKFDPAWFHEKNPYWTKLVYTLNYLEDIDEIPNTEKFESMKVPCTMFQSPTDEIYVAGSLSHTIIPNSSNIYLQSTVINNNINFDNRTTGFYSYGIKPNSKCAIVHYVKVSTDSYSNTYTYWSSLGGTFYKPNIPGLWESNRITAFSLSDFLTPVGIKTDFIRQTTASILPKIDISVVEGDEEKEHTITIESYIYAPEHPFVLWTGAYGSSKVDLWDYFNNMSMTEDILLSYKTTKSNTINVGLKLLYLEEEPIFNILLQYTKMYGLYWKLDDVGRTVTIMRPSTYFKDYSIENWDHKLDRSKDYVIEPITFDSNYVNFNYEDVDGFKYTSYKDKYGVNYGAKKLKTNYNFDSDDKDLFEGVNPSLISQRSFVKFSSLRDWDINKSTLPIIPSKLDEVPRIESVDTDDQKAINSSSWYFRLGNILLSEPAYITDDSELMTKENNCCWYTRAWLNELHEASSKDVVQVNTLPQFQIVTGIGQKTFGCIFNRPQEDYTYDKSITNSLNGYIYDNIWDKFINERYNVQNKKVVAYFDITPWEYIKFDFSKFVVLDNQLFMVNKIFDYDINSSDTTKCELVQVTDIYNYIDDTIVFDNLPNDYLLTINQIPITASVVINGVATNTYRADAGSLLTYTVLEEGYKTQTGTVQLNSDLTLTVELEKDLDAIYRVSIVPIAGTAIAEDAIVTLDASGVDTVVGLGTQSITVPAWTEVRWKVELEGYQTQVGSYVARQDITHHVRLIANDENAVTLTINVNPEEADVTINSIPTKSLTVAAGSRCRYIVSCTGYVTISEEIVVNEDTILNIEMVEENSGDFTFTIIPTPSDANVYMRKRGDTVVAGEDIVEGVGTQSIPCKAGDFVSWSVSKEGYEKVSGSSLITGDKTLEVVLEGAYSSNYFKARYRNRTLFADNRYGDTFKEIVAVVQNGDEKYYYMYDQDNTPNDDSDNAVMLGDDFDVNQDATIYLKPDAHPFFGGSNSYRTIGLRYLYYYDLSGVQNLNTLFKGCKFLERVVDLNTTGCTNMSSMFYGCSSLTSIPLLDTSNVTYEYGMNSMFYGCSSLTSIPLLDTSNVKSMSSMFYGCSSLTSIPQLNTRSVTSMREMFYGCSSLTSVPLLDASNVTSTGIDGAPTAVSPGYARMFYGCSSLTDFGGLANLKVDLHLQDSPLLTHESLMNVINNLATATATLRLSQESMDKLTDADIQIATAKGWTVKV